MADPDGHDDVDLDAAIDELYTRPPAEFVAAREALARQLRRAKRRDDARAVHALARPTLVAWVVDQLARRHAEELAALVAAGSALRRAQEQALGGGGPAGLRDAAQQRRRAAGQLLALARPILEERGTDPDAHADELGGALDTLALDADAAALAVRGRLARAPEPPSGLGFDVGVGSQEGGSQGADEAEVDREATSAAEADTGDAAERGEATAPRAADEVADGGNARAGAAARAVAVAQEAVSRAEGALVRVQRTREEADAAWRTAGQRAEAIGATVARLEAELANRRSRLHDAEREVSRLAHDVRRRTVDVDRATAAYEQARQTLAELEQAAAGPTQPRGRKRSTPGGRGSR